MVSLTKEQLDALQKLGDELSLIDMEIGRAKSAGLDVSGLEKQLADMKKLREGLLRVYGGTVTRRTIS